MNHHPLRSFVSARSAVPYQDAGSTDSSLVIIVVQDEACIPRGRANTVHRHNNQGYLIGWLLHFGQAHGPIFPTGLKALPHRQQDLIGWAGPYYYTR